MKVFHIYRSGYARGFTRPDGLFEKAVLWLRGWRPHVFGTLWQIPNGKQRRADNGGEKL